MRSPYDYADKMLAKLKQYVSAEFHNTANLMAFDEINVASVKALTVDLYDRLMSRNEQVFRRVIRQAYGAVSGDEMSEGIDVALVLVLMNRYHPVTQYVYRREARRKQERLMEAILSAPDRETARAAFNKAAKLWFNQSRQYVDFSVADAREHAFKDAGVEKVRYRSEHDERTCTECRAFDGKVFRLQDAPWLPRHHRCRCWLEPVRE